MSALARGAAAGPLLSVCLPCYNGAAYLGVVLEALLPQAKDAGKRVEILVVDDCSTDDTTAVVNRAMQHGPVRYLRNETNLGMSNNIVTATSRHAAGEYVWVMSQHNVVSPGALARVLDVLSGNLHHDAFYVNFRAAKYPEQWPVTAVGGYDGPFHYLANADCSNHELKRWEDVLDARTSVASQTYAHVVRRRLTTEFWAGRTIGRKFTTSANAYSQTFAVAHIMFGRPAYYIGQPVMTIYDGAQTWGSLRQQAMVYFQAYPDLLDHYARLGWKGARLAEARAWGSDRAGQVMAQLLREWHPEEGRVAAKYLLKYGHQRGTIAAAWRALLDTRGRGLSRLIERSGRAAADARQYFFSNWRPARWIRARIK